MAKKGMKSDNKKIQNLTKKRKEKAKKFKKALEISKKIANLAQIFLKNQCKNLAPTVRETP